MLRKQKRKGGINKMKFNEAVKLVVFGIVVIGILMALLGFNGSQIDKFLGWIIALGINFILSAYVGEAIENFGLGWLKGISFTVGEEDGFNFSISLFVILVFVIKFLVFK